MRVRLSVPCVAAAPEDQEAAYAFGIRRPLLRQAHWQRKAGADGNGPRQDGLAKGLAVLPFYGSRVVYSRVHTDSVGLVFAEQGCEQAPRDGAVCDPRRTPML